MCRPGKAKATVRPAERQARQRAGRAGQGPASHCHPHRPS